MVARPLQRLARSAPWALRFAALPIPLILLAALLHRYAVIDLEPMFATLALAWLLAAAALLLAGLALHSIWMNGDKGLKPALLALLLSLVALALPLAVVFDMIRLPRIADLTTDRTDPPLFTTAPEDVTMRPLPGSRALAAQASAYPDIVARHYPQSPEQVFDAISGLVAGDGWRVTDSRAPDPDNEVGWIEAEGRTLLFSLPVDIVIRVIADEDGSLVDIRSASRIGAHDLGDNAARIRGFFAALDAAMQGVVANGDGGVDDDGGATPAEDLPPLPIPSPVSGR